MNIIRVQKFGSWHDGFQPAVHALSGTHHTPHGSVEVYSRRHIVLAEGHELNALTRLRMAKSGIGWEVYEDGSYEAAELAQLASRFALAVTQLSNEEAAAYAIAPSPDLFGEPLTLPPPTTCLMLQLVFEADARRVILACLVVHGHVPQEYEQSFSAGLEALGHPLVLAHPGDLDLRTNRLTLTLESIPALTAFETNLREILTDGGWKVSEYCPAPEQLP